jgi:hypothetical protein
MQLIDPKRMTRTNMIYQKKKDQDLNVIEKPEAYNIFIFKQQNHIEGKGHANMPFHSSNHQHCNLA